MEEKVHRYKLLQRFYPELKTTAERVKKYRTERYNDDPLKILKRDPNAPPVGEDGLVIGPHEKVQIVKEVDATTGEVRTQKNYNLFRDVFPKMDCPKCGKQKCMQLHPICGGCSDSKDGKNKTYWGCLKCGNKVLSEKGVIEWWKELTGGSDFSQYLPDSHGFIPKIMLDPDRPKGGGDLG